MIFGYDFKIVIQLLLGEQLKSKIYVYLEIAVDREKERFILELTHMIMEAGKSHHPPSAS